MRNPVPDDPIAARERDFTVLTCHFGDPAWVRHSLAMLDRFSDGRVREVVVVDQDRAASKGLDGLPRVRQVIQFPVDEDQVAILGHDHPASLNRALGTIEIRTSHVIVLDSDCFPIDASWLDRLEDVTLAGDPAKWGLTHPCIMVFPAQVAAEIDFAEGLREVGIDTGRLIGLQLARRGYQVAMSRPEGAFRGKRGTLYLDRTVYHHGSSSFLSSSDPRLRSSVDAVSERVYRSAVMAGAYQLSLSNRFRLFTHRLRCRAQALLRRPVRS